MQINDQDSQKIKDILAQLNIKFNRKTKAIVGEFLNKNGGLEKLDELKRQSMVSQRTTYQPRYSTQTHTEHDRSSKFARNTIIDRSTAIDRSTVVERNSYMPQLQQQQQQTHKTGIRSSILSRIVPKTAPPPPPPPAQGHDMLDLLKNELDKMAPFLSNILLYF